MIREYELIGAALGWGARNRATEFGPEFFLNSKLFKNSIVYKRLKEQYSLMTSIKSTQEINIPLGYELLPYVLEYNERLANETYSAINKNKFPIVIGGDHSLAVGHWSGVIKALNAKENFGLIWVDAHYDAHTTETTVTKAYHGMPVSALLGYKKSELANVFGYQPKISPKHFVYIGVRSFDGGEKALVERLGIKTYSMQDIEELGLAIIIKQSIDFITKKTKYFGLSIDLDAFDPKDAPGTGSPVLDGIRAQEFINCLDLIYKHPNLKGLEIVEFNPYEDKDDRTLQIIIDIIAKLVA